jgi:L-lactate dehydrogenase complex protein LldG
MLASSAKETILKKIRQALANPVPVPFPKSEGNQSVYPEGVEDEAILFAETVSALQGKFAFCSSVEDLRNQLSTLFLNNQWQKIYCVEEKILRILGTNVNAYPRLDDCDVSVTGCEYLVARTGSMVLSANQAHGRTASVYAPVHICIAFTSQMVYDLKDALHFLKHKYESAFPSMITFATGPSRTADIEKTLVTGVHGPGEVYCFLVEDSPV